MESIVSAVPIVALDVADITAALEIVDALGDSFTNSGFLVAARAPLMTAFSASGSAPNSMPPLLTFGQLTLSSNA